MVALAERTFAYKGVMQARAIQEDQTGSSGQPAAQRAAQQHPAAQRITAARQGLHATTVPALAPGEDYLTARLAEEQHP